MLTAETLGACGEVPETLDVTLLAERAWKCLVGNNVDHQQCIVT